MVYNGNKLEAGKTSGYEIAGPRLQWEGIIESIKARPPRPLYPLPSTNALTCVIHSTFIT